ncbi:MAG: YciI family protein [Candidatus Dormibacteria bacterium]
MEYFVYGRDKPDTGDLRRELAEVHWAFMDRFADSMVARGPTLLTGSADEMTGSVHIVDLPDARAADDFAHQEPYYRAGVFENVLIRRWHNSLGRTMWDFVGGDGQRFLVIGHGAKNAAFRRAEHRDHQVEYLADGGFTKGLIVCGPLLSDDGSEWRGTALLVELADRGTAESMLNEGPYAEAGLYRAVEIHDWRFGGRPQP